MGGGWMDGYLLRTHLGTFSKFVRKSFHCMATSGISSRAHLSQLLNPSAPPKLAEGRMGWSEIAASGF